MSVCIAHNPDCDIFLIAAIDSISKNDSIKRANDSIVAINDSLHRIISDNITIDALKSSQIFYNNAFDSLLFKVSIILCVIGFIISVVGIALGFVKSSKEKELAKIIKRIVSSENKLREIQDNFNLLFSKEAHHYFTLAQNTKDNITILMNLSSMYYLLSKMSELNDIWLYILKRTQEFLDVYKEGESIEDIYGNFFHSLLLFIKNAEKINSKVFFEEAKGIYNNLLEKFNYDKVKKSLKGYLENSEFDTKEGLILFEKYRYSK